MFSTRVKRVKAAFTGGIVLFADSMKKAGDCEEPVPDLFFTVPCAKEVRGDSDLTYNLLL